MTTQGGLSYHDLIRMDDMELGSWYQRCIDYNEQAEEEMGRARGRR